MFAHMFEFVDDHPLIDEALQVIKTRIFGDILVSMKNFNQRNETVQDWTECYNVAGEPDDDDPQDINIPKSEGTHVVQGFGISSNQFLNPLKVKKVNIGSL